MLLCTHRYTYIVRLISVRRKPPGEMTRPLLGGFFPGSPQATSMAMRAAMQSRAAVRGAMAMRSMLGRQSGATSVLSTKVTGGDSGVYPSAPSPLQEFSVVYTDRALNHMSEPFKQVMLDIGSTLKEVYAAEHCVLIPGSGTYGMESVARQFATGKKVMVLRNGYFSYRWTDIFQACDIPSEHIVVKARCVDPKRGCGTNECECQLKAQYQPMPIDELEALIAKERPAVLFAPHVETSTGILLPPEYIKRAADAVHKAGGLFVLDGVASVRSRTLLLLLSTP